MDSFSKKRIASGALIFKEDEVLIVKPEYKDYWSFPGGVVEALEAPAEGLKRESKEEMGLGIRVVKPLVIEYIIRSERDEESESIQFLFLCELENGEKFSNIKLAKGEISEYRFVSAEKAMSMISQRSAKRLKAGLESLEKGGIVYLESKYE